MCIRDSLSGYLLSGVACYATKEERGFRFDDYGALRRYGISDSNGLGTVSYTHLLHPTEKDLELEQSVKEKDLYLD